MASGVVLSLVPLAWSMFVHTQTNAVAVVDAIAKQPNSAVKAVVTESTVAGRELAESMPGNTTVVAGSSAAAAVAAK
jgi:putative heme iron utilization protein